MTLHILPACEQDDNEPDIECVTCMDSGEVQVGEYGLPLPCPDCGLSDLWTGWHEANDEGRRER